MDKRAEHRDVPGKTGPSGWRAAADERENEGV
jgi:hypothetical protein